MSVETAAPLPDVVPPPGFQFNPEDMSDYDDQVRRAIAEAKHQATPLPSFENVPTVNIEPTFNPTHSPESEIYARDRVPDSFRGLNWKTRAEWSGDKEPVVLWRVVDRAKLKDGTGLVSSRVLLSNSLGDVEGFASEKHMVSHHDKRMSDPELATPFVSFSSDPTDLAKTVILRHGFGIKDGRDSVVVRVHADPHRVITEKNDKSSEVLLTGGVSPDEYVAAYSVADFVAQFMTEDETVQVDEQQMTRDRALGHWALGER